MKIVAIVCSIFFIGSAFNLLTGIGDESAIADQGASWGVTTLYGIMAVCSWTYFGFRRSRGTLRGKYFMVASIALCLAAVPLIAAANQIPKQAQSRAYGSIDLTLSGDLSGTHKPFADSSLIEQWNISSAAKLRNVTGWHTSVSLFIDHPWVMRNFSIDLVLPHGKVVNCEMTNGYTHVAAVITADCDTMILYQDMNSVQSAVVHINTSGA